MKRDTPRPVPVRALLLSFAALAVPVIVVLVFPDWAQDDQGVLIWLSSLIPAFLFAFYRGMRGVAVAVAGAMAVLSLTQVAVLLSGSTAPDWYVLLAVIAIYIGVCIGLAVFSEILHRERRAAEELSLVDSLTGLPNRRHAEVVLDAQFAAAVRGRPVAVLMFDIDNFKRVNDRHGHNAGDAVLRAIGEVLRQNTRRMDLSARFGGEEFISVLSECPLAAATALADRIRAGVEALTFPWGSVTVSAGVAAYEPGMASHEVLVAAADRAMYTSKQLGRNRVTGTMPIPPEAQTPPAAPAPAAAPQASGQGRGETVLLIDDEPAVLRAVAKLLRQGGYRVEETTDPDVVLRRFGEAAPPDLLVADIMMPRMNGLILTDRIAAAHPGLRVVYLSGYLGRDVSWAGMPGAVTGFVAKPVDSQNLLATTRDVLDRAVGGG
jgi:diguanylate cyclase (GGDEF)-like protein